MKRPLILLCSIALLATACSGGDDESTDETTVPTTSTSTTRLTTTTRATTTTTVPAPESWLLTGLPSEAGEQPATNNEVLIAKYSNAPNGRPQQGLDQADLLMEVLVEGGVSRILAVFQSDIPATIGPLRSAREVDPKLIEPFSGFFASSGGQPAVLADIDEVATNVSDGRGPGYFRQSGRRAPYNLFLETAELFGTAEVDPPSSFSIPFSTEEPEGERALSVEVDMSTFHTTNYRYSAVDDGYLRFNGEEPHETTEGDQLVASSVVVVFVEQLSTGRVDSSGSPVPDFEVVGSGDAVVFRDGVAVPGTWERGRTADFFRLFDADGAEIALKPGQSWFEIVPTGRTVEWQ